MKVKLGGVVAVLFCAIAQAEAQTLTVSGVIERSFRHPMLSVFSGALYRENIELYKSQLGDSHGAYEKKLKELIRVGLDGHKEVNIKPLEGEIVTAYIPLKLFKLCLNDADPFDSKKRVFCFTCRTVALSSGEVMKVVAISREEVVR